jgi:hypothetical protein
MTFAAVSVTMKVSSFGSSVASITVTRSGGIPFRLLPSSSPLTVNPGDPPLPTVPGQPFDCAWSNNLTGPQKSTLTFLASALTDWGPEFTNRRSLRLQMEVRGRPTELMTVNLASAVQSASAVGLAATKVVETGGDLFHAIVTLFKVIILNFKSHPREEEPELIPANGPNRLE